MVPVQVTEHVFIARTCPVWRPSPSAHRATGRRTTGAPAPGRQPDQPHRHVAGRGAAAHPQRPVDTVPVAPQRGSHRERHSSDRAAGPTAVAAILDRIRASPVVHADETGWRMTGPMARVDFQRCAANATSCGGVGAVAWTSRAWRIVLRSAGQRLRAYHHYAVAVAAVGPPAAGHPRPAHPLPQRRRTGPMGRGSPPALGSQSLQPSRAMAKACCPTGLGAEAAGHLPSIPRSDPSAVQGKLCRRIDHIKELFVLRGLLCHSGQQCRGAVSAIWPTA